MARVVFYFDGFNFYNGLKAKSEIEPQWLNYYWLDMAKFCTQFLDNPDDLLCIKYFTAPPTNQGKRSRQSAFFGANKILNGDKFQIIEGNYQNKEIKCKKCKEPFPHPEEKRTDVSICATMLVDCFNNIVDTLILITADSDQIPTIKAIKTSFPTKKIKVYFPPERKSNEIFNLCKPVVFLGDNELKFKNSTMANIVKNDKKNYVRPNEWKH